MPAPAFAFAVAVVGDPAALTPDQVRRLVDLLVNRHRGDRRIVLLGAAGGPPLDWAHGCGWSVQLVPGGGGPVKRDCELLAGADAVLVLGDPAPWRRLVALAAEARVPVRVYRSCPRLPPAPDFDPDRIYRGDA